MLAVIILAVYAAICAVLAAAARAYCRRGGLFRAPSKPLFILLSLTWGLPSTLCGAFFALWLTLLRRRGERCGPCRVFYMDKQNFGLSLGLFIFVPASARELRAHELGHSIQNIWFGPFMPGVVMIPSFSRFWLREIDRKKRARPARPVRPGDPARQARRARPRPSVPYDAIWFEGSATKSGGALLGGDAPDGV